MKKVLFIFTLLLAMSFGVNAQTTVVVNPDSAGTVERYQAISYIDEIPVIWNDTVISYDTVGDVIDTVITVLSDTTYEYDTLFMQGFYDYRAIANPGFIFNRWEVITQYTQWVDFDNPDSTGAYPVYDSSWFDTIVQYDVEYWYDDDQHDTIYWDGWLDFDGGIPDLNDTTIEGISSILINAYFIEDTTGCDPVGIGQIDQMNYKVYPNPTSSSINITGDVHWVTILDQFGRVVISTDKPIINIQSYPSGVYYVRVSDSKNRMGVTTLIKR